jgi:membrane fusion protein (multidrug efflux system)
MHEATIQIGAAGMSDNAVGTELARADTAQVPGDDNRPDQTATPTKDFESDSGHKYSGKDKAEEAGNNKRRPLVVAVGILVVVLLVAGGLFYWLTTRNLETTDDAYTDGRAIAIAPQVSGMVVSLDVTDNQFVKQGQLLIHIDRRQYDTDREQAEGALATAQSQYAGQQFAAEIARKNFPALLEQAQAQLATARANLTKAQADYDRQRSLSKPATSQQEVDAATAALKQAQAQVMLAEAQVTQNSPVPQRIGETDAQRSYSCDMLRDLGYNVLEAENGSAGLKLLGAQT